MFQKSDAHLLDLYTMMLSHHSQNNLLPQNTHALDILYTTSINKHHVFWSNVPKSLQNLSSPETFIPKSPHPKNTPRIYGSLVGGWTNPYEKYARQIGSFFQGSRWTKDFLFKKPRIIPFSKWIINMVSKSSIPCCSPSKWPFHGL